MSKLSRNKTILAVLVAAVVAAYGSLVAFAGESLLSAGGSSVTAGEAMSFTVNLADVIEEYKESTEGFTLTVNISPSPESVSVSPDVNIHQYGSKYTVSSADLTNVTALTFKVYTSSELTSETTYTVSASIAGNQSTPSDSFSFTATPKETEESDDSSQQSGSTDQSASGGSSQSGQSGKLPSGGKSGSMPSGGKSGSMPSGSASASAGSSGASMSGSGASSSSGSSTDTVTYEGSADNYLKSLKVSGYKLTQKFNKTRDTYFVHVPAGKKSLSVSATACDSSATVRIAGQDNVSAENSKILISVTADNGDVRVYRIYVSHETEDE